MLGSRSMAFDWTLGSFFRPSVLGVLLAVVSPGSAQFCSFWNRGCIDPMAQTAVPVDFQPLFPDPITFFYGFDASVTGNGDGPMTKTGFWMQYLNNRINRDAVDTNRTSEIALRMGNLTGVPSGTNNGCDGIWGQPCSDALKNSLQGAMFLLANSGDYYSKPLEAALSQMLLDPPSLGACPTPMFDVSAIPVQDFATESMPEQNVTVMTPGSATHPWQIWYLDGMTAHQQAEQVALGILSRGPSYNSPPPHSPDDIQVEIVCLQAPSSGLTARSH